MSRDPGTTRGPDHILDAEAHLELIRPLGRYGLDGQVLETYNAEVCRGIVHTPEYDAKMAWLQGWFDMAGWRGHRDGSPQPQSDGYFEPTPGAPADACPHCGIHRRHAGDPLACGEGWKQPGCFDPKAKP